MKYPTTEIFDSIQGEGAMVGVPMTFIRLAGCSIGCAQCDTDYKMRERLSADEITKCCAMEWVWITGGEPLDHDLSELIGALRKANKKIAIATSGVHPVRHVINFLSVSPHSLDLLLNCGEEIKLVPGLNGLNLAEFLHWNDVSKFRHKFIQPLWGDEHSLRASIEFVESNPDWRLSPQAHKQWGLS